MSLHRTIHASAHDIPLPDASVQCIVTSPPYWGLRKYEGDQYVEWPEVTYRLNEWTPEITIPDMTSPLGLEADPISYIGHMILCLREWRRVLRADGTLWLNIADSYNNYRPGYEAQSKQTLAKHNGAVIDVSGKRGIKQLLKEKDLCGIPWLLAMAARADGWWLRSDTVWAKPNPMPESVTDRPTRAHEYIFLLTPSARYYYDADAVREAHAEPWRGHGEADSLGISKRLQESDGLTRPFSSVEDRNTRNYNPLGRNLRSVWTFATQPTPYAHFATFPERLPETCIKAGTSARGCCPTCGAPWERVVEKGEKVADSAEYKPRGKKAFDNYVHTGMVSPNDDQPTPNHHYEYTTTGWQPTCEHDAEPVPCVVLDPYHGSGTTGVVALRLGRAYVGVDISAEYLDGVSNERLARGAQIGMGL
jgi:DNA modification methylase